MVLCLEVAGVDGKDSREGGIGEGGVYSTELVEARGREGGFGGYVDCGAVKTMGGWELHCEEEQEKDLGFSRAAVGVSCGANS